MTMKLRLITVAFDTEQGGFPADPLAEIEGEVLSVVEHFFHTDERPHLLLVVHYRPAREIRAAPQPQPQARPADPGVRAELSEPERDVFDRLRSWRNSRAVAEGIPPYVLLTNRQLAEVARRRPTTLSALREVGGIGEAKAGRFGTDLLAVVVAAVERPELGRAATGAAHAA